MFCAIWDGDKDEEMLKKVKVGKNAKERFIEMSKNRKMQNGLRSQMMQLNSPELPKSIEKFWHGKCKATFHEITEHNGFKGTFHRVIFSFPCTPLDHALSLEEPHILQILHHWFRHFIFALARWKISNCFVFNRGFVFLGSHLNVTSLGSGAKRGVNGCYRQLGSVNLKVTAARSQEDESPKSYRLGLYGLWWHFREYLEYQRMVYFSGSFHHIFCHEFFYS